MAAKSTDELTRLDARQGREEHVVIFRLADEFYALDIQSVQEIVRMQTITAIPGSDPWVEGITNLRGRVQRFMQAKAAPGVARPTWYVLGDLLHQMGGSDSYYLPSDVFSAMTATHAPFAGLDYSALGLQGATAHAATSAEATAGSGHALSGFGV